MEQRSETHQPFIVYSNSARHWPHVQANLTYCATGHRSKCSINLEEHRRHIFALDPACHRWSFRAQQLPRSLRLQCQVCLNRPPYDLPDRQGWQAPRSPEALLLGTAMARPTMETQKSYGNGRRMLFVYRACADTSLRVCCSSGWTQSAPAENPRRRALLPSTQPQLSQRRSRLYCSVQQRQTKSSGSKAKMLHWTPEGGESQPHSRRCTLKKG